MGSVLDFHWYWYDNSFNSDSSFNLSTGINCILPHDGLWAQVWFT